MPSFTSSSNVYYRDIPDRAWHKFIAIAVVLMVVGIGFWEMLARSMYHVPGTYQGLGFMWADERRKLDGDSDVRVVLTGSSRMLWAADLDILEEKLGTRPIQLSLPGTGPALIVEDIIENTDFNGLILVGATPRLFNSLGKGFSGGLAFERYHSQSPSQWSGNKLHRFLSDYFGFLDDAFDLFSLIERYSNFEDRPDAEDLKSGLWKLGNFYDDYQADMWEPVETPGSFDNTQITNFWTPGLNRPAMSEEDTAERVQKTIEFFVPLIKKLQDRGGDIVFIRMPSDGRYLERDIESNHKEKMWQPMAEGFGATAINTHDYPHLSTDLEIPEWSHLSRKSQDDWSRDIVPLLDEQFKAYRGKSIFDVINPDKNAGDDQ